MAQKKFSTWNAADYVGIDARSNALEEDSVSVARAINFEFSPSNNLRGRAGCQIAADYRMKFFGVFPYVYSRTNDDYPASYVAPSGAHPNQTGTLTTTKIAADGTTIQKLIATNQQFWTLDSFTIPITVVSGSYPFTWYMTRNATDLVFKIKANGTEIFSYNLGDGGVSAVVGTNTLWDLLGAIDATAELAVNRLSRQVCPPFAIVDGNQVPVVVAAAPYGQVLRITVKNTPHNFYPGDIITYVSNDTFVSGFVRARTATTIDFVGLFNPALTDGQILGYMGQAASTFQLGPANSASSGSLNISFPYWRVIPEGDLNSAFGWGNPLGASAIFWQQRQIDSSYAPPVSVNHQDCLYVASSQKQQFPVPYRGWGSVVNTGVAGSLVKTDGLTIVRAGIGQPNINALTLTAGGALTGTYKYKFYIRRVDGQGNVTEGNPSTEKTVTCAANYCNLTLEFYKYVNTTGWLQRSAFKNTTESPAAGQFFYVDDGAGGAPFLQPNDPIFLTDNTAQKNGLWAAGAFGVTPIGTLHATKCSAYDGVNFAIKVADSSGYQINDNTPISTGLTAVVLRTTAGGVQFYQLCEVPIEGTTNFSFIDNVTDAVLSAGIQYTEIALGKEHDPPPPCSLVCEHQGGLVVAKGITDPNNVAFSTASGSEYFPLASNNFTVPSTRSGYVTAIASDTDDQLAVFKDKSFYSVIGDLDGGLFSIQIRNENDYGIVSQASLRRVQNSLIGLSRNGFVEISNGFLNPYKFEKLNTRIINQNFNWSAAVAVNDPASRSYICSIPKIVIDQNVYSPAITFVFDYSKILEDGTNLISFERSYWYRIDPGTGYASLGDDLYHLSGTWPALLFKRSYRFNGDSPGAGDGDSFYDNTSPIQYVLENNAQVITKPELLKTPIRLRIWSIPNNYVNEGWVPFSVLLETGISPDAALIGGTNQNATTSTVTFANQQGLWRDIKILNVKANFIIWRLTTYTVAQSPFITGVTTLYAESYNDEDLLK